MLQLQMIMSHQMRGWFMKKCDGMILEDLSSRSIGNLITNLSPVRLAPYASNFNKWIGSASSFNNMCRTAKDENEKMKARER